MPVLELLKVFYNVLDHNRELLFTPTEMIPQLFEEFFLEIDEGDTDSNDH